MCRIMTNKLGECEVLYFLLMKYREVYLQSPTLFFAPFYLVSWDNVSIVMFFFY